MKSSKKRSPHSAKPSRSAANKRIQRKKNMSATRPLAQMQTLLGNRATSQLIQQSETAPHIQRALKLSSTNNSAEGKQQEINIILRYIERAAGLPPNALSWTPAEPIVQLNGMMEEAKEEVESTIRELLLDGEITAFVKIGSDTGGVGDMKNVAIGSFPSDSWAQGEEENRTQIVNLDHLVAFEQGVPGMGAALAMHEIFENYMAHKQFVKQKRPYDPAHAEALQLEGAVAAKLTDAGKRLSENIEPVGDPRMNQQDGAHFNGQPHIAMDCLVRFENKDLLFTQLIGPGQDSYKFINIRLENKPEEGMVAEEHVEHVEDVKTVKEKDGKCVIF